MRKKRGGGCRVAHRRKTVNDTVWRKRHNVAFADAPTVVSKPVMPLNFGKRSKSTS